MRVQTGYIDADTALYPETARFLAGRLRHQMTDTQKARMEGLVEYSEWIDEPTRLLTSGEIYDHSTMLIDGFMLRTIDGDDRRYAVSFHVPGDFVDLHCFALKRLDHNIDTVGRAKVGYVPHAELARVMQTDPELARILWFSTLLDSAMHREWIMKLEQLTTARRLAHIFAEIAWRLQKVGLSDGLTFDTDLRQSELSEMAGATTIHINRTLAELRKDEMAIFKRGHVSIPDIDRLHEFASFDPDYLFGEGAFTTSVGAARQD